METSRRTVLLGAAGAAAVAVAGCGGAQNTAAGGGGAGFPVTVPGKLGATTVSRRPGRVVACGYLRDTDLAIALGANLVGLAKNPVFPDGLAPWQRPTTNPQRFAVTNGLPLEKIAGLRPDLILAADDYKLTADYATLTKLGPVLGYASGVGADSWQDMARRAGLVLGARDRAEQLVGQVQRQVTATRTAHPEFAGKTFTFGPISADGSIHTTNSTKDAAAVFFAQLGMHLSPKVTALPHGGPAGRAVVSPERLDVLDADVLMLTFASADARTRFEANPLFQALPAVRRGSYLGLDLAPAVALAFPSVLSIPYGITAVVPKLAAAVAKT